MGHLAISIMMKKKLQKYDIKRGFEKFKICNFCSKILIAIILTALVHTQNDTKCCTNKNYRENNHFKRRKSNNESVAFILSWTFLGINITTLIYFLTSLKCS